MLSREGSPPAGTPNNLGEFLVAEGYVSETRLSEATRRSEEDDRSLGQTLVSLGYLTPEELARALARMLKLEYVDLTVETVDPELLGLIAEDVLSRHVAVPVRVENGRLIVAMADPCDSDARSDLTISAGHPVTPAVAAEDAIRGLHERYFGREGRAPDGDAGGGPAPASNGAAGREDGDGRSVEARGRAAARPQSGNGRRGAARSPKLGEILVSEGKLTESQLEEALSIQRNDPRDLGDILISLGFVDAQDLARALAKRLKLDFVILSELTESEVDPDVLNLMDPATLRKYMALPLRFEGGRMIVAMSNPNDLFALEDLRIIAKHPISPVVATVEDLSGALDHLFGLETASEDYAEDFVEEERAVYEYVDQEVPSTPPEPVESPTEEVEASSPEVSEEETGVTEAVPEPAEEPATEPAREFRRIGGVGTRLGDILVSQGKLSPEQLEEALEIQRSDRREIGKILLSLGYVSNVDLARAIATKLRLDYLEITENDVDRAATSLVDQRVLRRHGVMPLRVADGRLVVAMSDPTNIHALEDLMMISGYPVTPVVALEEEIRRVQNKLFAVGEEVTELLQEAAGESVFDDQGEVELGGDTAADDAPIVRLVGSILQQAVGEGASDIHVEPRARELTVRFRVDGVLREIMSIPPKLQSGVIARLKILANLDIAERRIPQDGRFSVRLGGQKIDVRVASLPTVFGEKLVLRLLDTSNVEADLKQLGFAPEMFRAYEQIFRRPYGAILVTGPTGSGKSTTLYATLSELNSPERNIITVEDPVEFRMEGISQIQVNLKAGLTFASGLRSILRSDPDVVMIGEIRDYETAKISVEAALTGHLVLATLHTNNAPAAVNRLTDMGVEPFLTSSAVDCVIAQRLARRLCDYCRRPTEVAEDVLADIGFPFEHAPEDGLRFHAAVGCDRCGGTGYKGRLGIYELMVVNSEIRELILRRVSTDEISQLAEEQGMIRLRDDGLLKAAQGMTTIEEVLRTVV